MSDNEEEGDDYINFDLGKVGKVENEELPPVELKNENENDALKKPLESDKGMKLMKLMGYKPGESLGKDKSRDANVVVLDNKPDKSGIGAESAKKRELQQIHDDYVEKQKRAKIEYQSTKRDEMEEKRLQKLLKQAQNILIDLISDRDPDEYYEKVDLSKIPVEVRGVVSTYRTFKSFQESKNRREHGEFDYSNIANEEEQEDDKELEKFENSSIADQLDSVCDKLRDDFFYCFWCAAQYSEEDINECPGPKGSDHD